MLAGGIVDPGGGRSGSVSAYVAYNPSPGTSRLFKVHGSTDAPEITELEAATTIDLGRFKQELKQDLEPALEGIRAQGGTAAIATPKAEWVTEFVQRFLAEHG